MWLQTMCWFSLRTRQWKVTMTRTHSAHTFTLGAPLLGAVLVGLSACSSGLGASSSRSATAQFTPTPPAIATPTLPAASPLGWTAAQLPGAPRATLGVSQRDGVTAYDCVSPTNPSSATLATWVTHNQGASWQRTAVITVNIGSPVGVTSCQITVDTTQASTAIAQVGFLPSGPCFPAIDCTGYALYLTSDAGLHWGILQAPQAPGIQGPPGGSSSVPMSLDVLVTFATYQNVTYALFHSIPRSLSGEATALEMSRDHLRTWTPVPGLMGVKITGFWLNPVTGGLLIKSPGGADTTPEVFETSTAGGTDWRVLPSLPFFFNDIAVQQPFTDQPWQICGGDPISNVVHGVQQNQHTDTLACTADSGAHWEMHQLDVPNDPNNGANYTLVGITDDGSALLTTPTGLRRVVNGVAWTQLLGPAPNAGLVMYASGEGIGVLWNAPQNGYSDPDPQGRIFTVAYA